MAYTDDEYEFLHYPNMINIHDIKEGDTLWLLEREENYFTNNIEYVIHEVTCKNKQWAYSKPSEGAYILYSCDFEFYDEKQMCYSCYHKTEDELKKQPKYEGRFFTDFEQAEKFRIEAETLYLKKNLKDCYKAITFAKEIETIFSDKGILDENLLNACKEYFNSPECNSDSVLYYLGNSIEEKLKKVAKVSQTKK